MSPPTLSPARFLHVAHALESRPGPILVQFPPNFKKDLPRLDAFLELVPREIRVALEFRHASWFADDVHDVLRGRGAALCIAQDDDLETPPVATASWGYLRLRRTDYADGALGEWARYVRAQDWTEGYVFFRHEDTGTGPRFARRFQEMFEGSSG